MAVTIDVKEGQTLTVAGPAKAVVTSDIPGCCLIDGQPIPGGYVPPGEAPAPGPAPSISTLVPATAVAGDAADITMIVTGADLVGATIVFDGNDEPTTVVSPTELSTGVKPSLFVVAADCPVSVRNSDGQVSNALTFSFTDPVTRAGSSKSRR